MSNNTPKIGTARDARVFIDGYVRDSFPSSYCQKMSKDVDTRYVYGYRCWVLFQTFYGFSAGEITTEENDTLINAGYSKDFIKELVGPDGKRALTEQAKWFADDLVSRQNKDKKSFERRKKELDTLANDLLPRITDEATKAHIANLLMKLLDDKVPLNKFNIVKALAYVGSSTNGAEERLKREITDTSNDKYLISAAIWALLNISSTIENYAFVIKAIETRKGNSGNAKETHEPKTLNDVIYALKSLLVSGSYDMVVTVFKSIGKDHLPEFIKTYKPHYSYIEDGVDLIINGAVNSPDLLNIPPMDILPILLAYFDYKSAQEIVEKMGDKALLIIPKIIELLEDEDAHFGHRALAAKMVAQIRKHIKPNDTRHVIEALIYALRYPLLCSEVTSALQAFADSKFIDLAIPPLMDMQFNDANIKCREQAEVALKAILEKVE